MARARIIERLRHGCGLIVFNSDTTQDVRLREARRALLDDLRAGLPDLYVQGVSVDVATAERVPINTVVRECWRRSQARTPFVLLVKEPLQRVETVAARVFCSSHELDCLCAADGVYALHRSDSLSLLSPLDEWAAGGAGNVPLTPIEEMLLKALQAESLEVAPQVRFAPYLVDFVVSRGDAKVVVEADGAGFHDPDRDRERDADILARHGLETVRFSGSEIFRSATQCAEIIRGRLSSRRSEAAARVVTLGELDQSQTAAVLNQAGDARVLAPAGSGKTRVLVERISYLVGKGVSPRSILALAFNKRAADQFEHELRERSIGLSRSLSGDDGVTACTLNAFGYRFLQWTGFDSLLLERPSLERRLVQGALDQAGITLPRVRNADPLDQVIAQLARVRRGIAVPGTDPLELTGQGGTEAHDFEPIWLAVRSAQEQQRAITFDDQIFLTVQRLLGDPSLRRQLQWRFSHVLVDEYQDLNPAQACLIRILTAGCSAVFAVGDDDQLIYSWRGARSDFILEDFERVYPGAATHTLSTNYRCKRLVVSASQRLIAHNVHRAPKSIRAKVDAEEGVCCIVGAGALASQAAIAARFLEMQRSQSGLEWKQMAILTRTRIQLLEAARALDAAGVPRAPLPGVRLFSTAAGRMLMCYLRLVEDAFAVSADDLAFIVNRPNRYTTAAFQASLRQAEAPWRFLKEQAELGTELAGSAVSNLRAMVETVESLHPRFGDTSPVELIRLIVEKFAPIRDAQKRASVEADEAGDDVVVDLIREAARSFDTAPEFVAWMEQKLAQELEGDAGSDAADDGSERPTNVVALATIHGAKGREWNAVVLFDLSEAPVPARRNPALAHENEEERRVFYVGLTRAQDALCITTRLGRPSAFIFEAFVPKQAGSNGRAGVDAAVAALATKTADLVEEHAHVEKLIKEREREVVAVRSGALAADIEKQWKVADWNLSEHRGRYEAAMRRTPDGMLKRFFSGGYSATELERARSRMAEDIAKAETEFKAIEYKRSHARELEDQSLARLEKKIAELKVRREKLERLRREGEELRRELAIARNLFGMSEATADAIVIAGNLLEPGPQELARACRMRAAGKGHLPS